MKNITSNINAKSVGWMLITPLRSNGWLMTLKLSMKVASSLHEQHFASGLYCDVQVLLLYGSILTWRSSRRPCVRRGWRRRWAGRRPRRRRARCPCRRARRAPPSGTSGSAARPTRCRPRPTSARLVGIVCLNYFIKFLIMMKLRHCERDCLCEREISF